MDRNEAIARIKAGLRARSTVPWSVTGGRGTSWGWIRIDAPPRMKTWRHRLPEGAEDVADNYVGYDSCRPGGSMTPTLRDELTGLLGLDRPCGLDGESVPAQGDYYQEYVDRAEGRAPSVRGVPRWD